MPAAPEPLRSYVRVQVGAERQIRAVLRSSLKEADRAIAALEGKTGIGAATRRAQYMAVRANLEYLNRRTFREIGAIISEQRTVAFDAAMGASEKQYMELFKAAGLGRDEAKVLLSGLKSQAGKGVNAMNTRLVSSAQGLSSQVYRTAALAQGRVDLAVNTSLTLGESAKELAARVRPLIDPNVRGGVSYAANRLARTEINNAFHAAAIFAVQNDPWVIGMKWNLSGSHPKPDICDELAGGSSGKDFATGVYDKTSVPKKPHPQCLCYVTAVTQDLDDFQQLLLSGAFDDYTKGSAA